MQLWNLQISSLRRKRVVAKIYYRRIKEGIMTVDEVPARWREEVQALLDGEVAE